MMKIPVSVYDYDNYRLFLKDYYDRAKSSNKKFSFRFFAREAGFKSFSFLRGIMLGSKNVSDEGAMKIAIGLKLTKDETFFFTNLVKFNQASDLNEKQRYAREIMKCRTFKQVHPLKASQYHFYSRWYLSAIRELPGLPDFREDPKWIAEKVRPSITVSEARRALDDLIKLGILERDSNGNLRQANTHLTTPDEVTASFAGEIHKDFLNLAGDSIQNTPREKRELSTVTLGISEQTMKKIKEMVQNFRKEVVNVAAQDSNVETIYQLSFQLFPLIKEKDES